MSLKNRIESMAEAFADELLRALRGASLDELLAASDARSVTSPRGAKTAAANGTPATTTRRPRAGRRVPRRSPTQIANVITSVIGALKNTKGGMTSEELQKALSIDKKVLVRPIAEALAEKTLRKTGQKRATRYFAV